MTGQFADRDAIANLKARYCRLLDGKDWAGYAALFTADVVFDATASGGPVMEGREAVVARIRASIDSAVTVHQVHSPEIAVDGDCAIAIWAMQDRLRWPDGRALDGAGHYHERYVRTATSWKIAHSRLTRLFVDIRQD